MTDVLVFHLEGNFRGNPTMDALLRDLSSRRLATTVVAGARPQLDQSAPAPGIAIRLLDGRRWAVLVRLLGRSRLLLRIFLRLQRIPAARVHVAVDREGAFMSDAHRGAATRLHVLISFEIFPRAEVGDRVKDPEVAACRHFDLAVAQDPVRADMLAKEIDFNRNRIIEVPVAPRGRPPVTTPGWLRARFGIDEAVRIAVMVGSVAAWSGSDLVTACAERLPPDWVLVLHDRHGFRGSPVKGLPGHVLLSTEPVPGIEGLSLLLADADAGIAFYTPSYDSPFLGDNLRHVGLASGKVGMYLQHGVPVVVNDQDYLGQVVTDQRVGVRIAAPEDFPSALASIAADRDGYRRRCEAFFDERLDAGRALAPVVSSIAATVGRQR